MLEEDPHLPARGNPDGHRRGVVPLPGSQHAVDVSRMAGRDLDVRDVPATGWS
ncbi:MAG TPA: hypothetical protein VMW75_19620 [Thermoanaerobaculia bacterium]|nr:hypothetical protein [Thermoanaerobaculia bacterium]